MIIGGMAGELGYHDRDFEGLDPDIQQMFYGEDAMVADETAGQEPDSVEGPAGPENTRSRPGSVTVRAQADPLAAVRRITPVTRAGKWTFRG